SLHEGSSGFGSAPRRRADRFAPLCRDSGLAPGPFAASYRPVRIRPALPRALRALRPERTGALRRRHVASALLPVRACVASMNVSRVSPRPLLEAEGLEKRYAVRRGVLGRSRGDLPALRGVSVTVGEGETLGRVGESGSGKTTTGRIVARLIEPDAGAVRFDGADWLALEGRELRRKRRELQVVFQDPQTSLNPRMRVGDQIGEP